MPQMKPLLWLMLMVLTSLSLFISFMMNYFQFNKMQMKSSIFNSKMIKINWKW